MKAATTIKLPKIVSKYHCAGDYLVTDGTDPRFAGQTLGCFGF